MKIETKFNVEDEVFLLHDNKVRSGRIRKIAITILDSTHIEIEYQINMQGITVDRIEGDIFKDKESLINSL